MKCQQNAEQAAYDASMTKTAYSLIAQLKDIARAFCLEFWGEALNVVGVDANAELRRFDKVFYPPTLRLALSSTHPNSSSASSAPKSTTVPTSTPSTRKEKEHQLSSPVIELESEDIVEVEQLKRKKKEK